jgi:hypothetical protein
MSIEYEFESDISKIPLPAGLTLDKDTLDAIQAEMKEMFGCISLGPLELCYSRQGENFNIKVKIFGIVAGSMTLGPSRNCQGIGLDLFLVSGSIEICIRGRCLVLNGKVCKFGSCTRWNNLQIVCF